MDVQMLWSRGNLVLLKVPYAPPDGRENGVRSAGVIRGPHFQEKGSIPEVLCSAAARGPSYTSSNRGCTRKEVKNPQPVPEGLGERATRQPLFQEAKKSLSQDPDLESPPAAGRLLLLLLPSLAKKVSSSISFCIKSASQLPALKCCLLGPRKACLLP